MGIKLRKYEPRDFLRIRDFLVANYKAFQHPVNWALVRWNYARYLVAPMTGARTYGVSLWGPTMGSRLWGPTMGSDLEFWHFYEA